MKSYKNLKKIKSNISPFLPIFFGCNRFILSGNTFYLIDTFSLKRSIILKQRRNVENQIYLSLIKVEFFFALIILTLYPHRQPTWGVSGWVEHNLNRIPHAHTYAYRYIYLHTIRTQYAHNFHTICTHTRHREHRTQNTDTNNHAQDNAQPQHRCITYDLHKYSFDYYHEFAYINNSNTIELYTILQDKV